MTSLVATASIVMQAEEPEEGVAPLAPPVTQGLFGIVDLIAGARGLGGSQLRAPT